MRDGELELQLREKPTDGQKLEDQILIANNTKTQVHSRGKSKLTKSPGKALTSASANTDNLKLLLILELSDSSRAASLPHYKLLPDSLSLS
jgi:hypothetical protein